MLHRVLAFVAAALPAAPVASQEAAAVENASAGTGSTATAPWSVHEWGTFTSLQGSDGVVLEGLQHEEEALPPFVHDLARLAGVGTGRAGPAQKFPASRVTQKMETPVLYFHTSVPRRVRVAVTFLDGLITQYYPMPQLVAPPLDELRARAAAGAVDLTEVDFSVAEWHLELTPECEGDGAAFPPVDPADPWGEARNVRAARVATADGEAERFVFYRGLGRFALPLRAVDDGSGPVLCNDGDQPVPFALAMEVGDDGRGRFRVLGAVPAGARIAADPEGGVLRAADAHVGALHVELRQALVAQGLHDDEARAMVETWSRQWFRSPGRRVLWIVPRRLVDVLLPLTLEPKPDAVVRVLVGRLECVTPVQEAAVERALEARFDRDAAVREPAEQYLRGLGRFLEPHLRRARARTGSERVRASARQLLEELTAR